MRRLRDNDVRVGNHLRSNLALLRGSCDYLEAHLLLLLLAGRHVPIELYLGWMVHFRQWRAERLAQRHFLLYVARRMGIRGVEACANCSGSLMRIIIARFRAA